MERSISLSVLFAFLLLFTLASAKLNDDLRLARSNLPSVQAEKLIRELNLFPKNDLNVIDDRYSSLPPKNKITEKRLVFPNFVGSGASVEDLGHHAGYYNIEHSHAARSALKP
jgi:serine carboxypeptidase-like clade 4